jgi:hypothetical protein
LLEIFNAVTQAFPMLIPDNITHLLNDAFFGSAAIARLTGTSTK